MLNGLDLFSGYGGITLALRNHVRPIMYCEIEKFAQGILLSRMDDGTIPFAPIWTDVTSLDGTKLRGVVDIVYGGFPCQDISAAGKGAGLDGKRSGLFFEVVRICKEASPLFIFLENVPAIRTRGAIEVAEALADIGYDCRWHHLSAAEVGANHKRERWFLLARKNVANSKGERYGKRGRPRDIHQEDGRPVGEMCSKLSGASKDASRVANPTSKRQSRSWKPIDASNSEKNFDGQTSDALDECFPGEWETEPEVGRVVNGYPTRTHELKALGNGVVPLQVETAFEILMGIRPTSVRPPELRGPNGENYSR
jgi:DNA (cytosine-5)-methyltransferase 1